MTARRGRVNWGGGRGLTRAEREMGGNTAEDRALIAGANAVPRGRRYRRDMESLGASARPAPASDDSGTPAASSTDTDKTE